MFNAQVTSMIFVLGSLNIHFFKLRKIFQVRWIAQYL